jgi:hypothetical protein
LSVFVSNLSELDKYNRALDWKAEKAAQIGGAVTCPFFNQP